MKYQIEGFSQEVAMSFKKEVIENGKVVTKKLDCTDLVILRWFVDFYPVMKKMEVDGKRYAWLAHSKLLEDLPLIDISKRAFAERMQKMCEFGILEYQFVKGNGGTFSLYTFGKNYISLVDRNGEGGMQKNDTVAVQTYTGGSGLNAYGVAVQTYTKDNNTNNTSIEDMSIDRNKKYIVEIPEIIDYLNEKLGTEYRAKSRVNRECITARLNEGYTVEDFKKVIDNKYEDWHGTEMELYLRPQTLFGTKFETYLNATNKKRKPSDAGRKSKYGITLE